MGEFDGKVALVTGGASGIGRAVALRLAGDGAQVLVGDIDEAGGEQTAKTITANGGVAAFRRSDVSKSGEVEALVREAAARFGRLDLAVNNAGIGGVLAPTADYPEDVFDEVIGVNLKGVFLGMKYEIPKMLEAGGGAIVNTASILGVVAFTTLAAYTASKHGVIGLTKVAALDYANQGVRVNAVCPGFIETPLVMEGPVNAGQDKAAYEMLVGLHPAGRLGRPEEVADAVAWLCSERASFVTGHALVIDGAYTAR